VNPWEVPESTWGFQVIPPEKRWGFQEVPPEKRRGFHHEASTLHGSESNLHQIKVKENNLADAKSYNPVKPSTKSYKPSHPIPTRVLNNNARVLNNNVEVQPHSFPRTKVQFVENEEFRWKYGGGSSENISNQQKHTNISPSKSIGGFMRYGSPGKKKEKRRRNVSEASTMSVSSASSTDTYSYSAPDGGYGWVVVAASFFVNMIADGVTFSFGVMFDEFEGEFDSTKAETAGVVAVFHAVPLLTGPLATWLTDRYGCRRVTIMGSILACAGFLLASFSHNIALLYLFFGVVSGFGLSLCYVAAIIIVAYYFDRRRSFATGISVCGSGVGTFVFAPLTQFLLDTFDGWRGACQVLAAIFLNMAVCGMLFRELPWSRKLRGRRTSSRSLSDMPEIDLLRSALVCGDVSVFLDSEEDEPRVASSLLNLPTYIKNSAKLPPDVMSLLANNKETYNYILYNYPDSLIAKSISDYAFDVEEAETIKDQESRVEKKEESTGVKLARRVSSLLKGPRTSFRREDVEVVVDNPRGEMEQPLVTSVTNNVVRKSWMPEPVKFEGKGVQEKRTSTEHERRLRNVELLKSQKLKELRMRRQSLTCRNRISQNRSSSCPDLMKTVIPEGPSESGCNLFKYFSVPFLVFCFSNCILYFWYDVPYVYTIEFAKNTLNISSQKSTHIISVIGILNTVGEVFVGWVGDQPWASSSALYAFCMVCCAVSTALMPLVDSYPLLLGLSAVYGFCISANYSLTSPILVDIVSIEHFSSAYGFLLASQGVANLVGPPFAGWLYDYTKEWNLTFGMAGLFIGISGLLLLILPVIQLISRRCDNQNKASTQAGEKRSWSNEHTKTNTGCAESAVLV